MFRKLKNTFNIKNYKVLEQRSCFLKDDRGIRYSEVLLEQFADIFNLIPQRYQKDFCLLIMEVDTAIPPHTDSGINVTVNVYIETDNCITQFYDLKSNTPRTFQVNNQTDGYLYNEEDLYKTDSFLANPGECWLLDVTKIHSVIPSGKFNKRTALSLATDKYDFDEVCDMLKEMGNL